MSGKIIQLDMFVAEKTQLIALEQDELKKIVTKSIRGLFARYNELEYTMLEMQNRLDRISQVAFKDE